MIKARTAGQSWYARQRREVDGELRQYINGYIIQILLTKPDNKLDETAEMLRDHPPGFVNTKRMKTHFVEEAARWCQMDKRFRRKMLDNIRKSKRMVKQ